MALPNTDPSLPSNPAPIFGDIDAARGDQMRANNNLIWGNFTFLYNWLTTIAGYFTGGVANNAAALNGHADTYFGTASAVSTLLGYFTGGVANSAEKLNIPVYNTSASIVATFDSLISGGYNVQEFMCGANVTAQPITAMTCIYKMEVYDGAYNNIVTCRGINTPEEYQIGKNGGTWGSWVKTRNADGSVPNATHVLATNYCHTAYATMGDLFTALAPVCNSINLSININGSFTTNSNAYLYIVSRARYVSSTQIELSVIYGNSNSWLPIIVPVNSGDSSAISASLSW